MTYRNGHLLMTSNKDELVFHENVCHIIATKQKKQHHIKICNLYVSFIYEMNICMGVINHEEDMKKSIFLISEHMS